MTRAKPAGLGTFPLEYAALGLLFEGPQHGYRLYRDFASGLRLIWKSGQANFYLALNNLEAVGHVTAVSEPQPGRPPRKIYQITEPGRAAFLEWLNTPVTSMRDFRIMFMARLHFFARLGLPGAGQLIDREIMVFEKLLAEWSVAGQPDEPGAAMVADYRRRQARMIIGWLAAWQGHFDPAAPRG